VKHFKPPFALRRPRHRTRRPRTAPFVRQVLTASAFVGIAVFAAAPQLTALWNTASLAEPQRLHLEHTAFYRNCDAARAAGAAPIYRGTPGYRDALDRDSDGIACEPLP
jgi:hypothetical protein